MAGIPLRDCWKGAAGKELDTEPITRVTAVLSYLAENNGALTFGSDTPSDPTYANPPSLNGRLEMDNWIAAGVSPAILFRAATIANAEFFGLQEDVGTVEKGKRADLLLMTKSPMKSVAAYDAIEVIIVSGKAILRSELSALKTEVDQE